MRPNLKNQGLTMHCFLKYLILQAFYCTKTLCAWAQLNEYGKSQSLLLFCKPCLFVFVTKGSQTISNSTLCIINWTSGSLVHGSSVKESFFGCNFNILSTIDKQCIKTT